MLLRTEKLTKSFGGLVAVKSVDLNVNQGEILGIIGPNGAGKTTLTNLISGVLYPTEGRIRFEDKDITFVPAHLRARMGIARTFQLVRPLRDFTAFENVVVSCLFARGESLREARKSARKICELVELEEPERRLDRLTVFELKKLEIARALGCQPKLLILDEVMAGLNSEEMQRIIQLVRSLREKQITICVIEHVMSVISQLTDRVIVLDRGEIIAEGPYEKVAHDPKVITAYLGEEA
ncbi:MAG: ABC transporter ATP-binding protein [Pseudothermotoga sp.]|uniref:ABC transporter ATP-binding protein n=1 Tax=Pseudothermotoga sp. TaxID=2033661 RepID=UPI00258582B7|nr:ABC transporter ATP-binding protein [Pseudothermotoga sp.]MDI6863519.1 ABC transporter ATP-binding protein [Pseudothermotoga sp.]